MYLVSRAPLILLDEVWSGMDEAMVKAARAYLRADGESGSARGVGVGIREDQAVVVISHWEEEVPWGVEDNLYAKTVEDAVEATAEGGPRRGRFSQRWYGPRICCDWHRKVCKGWRRLSHRQARRAG